MDSNILQIIEVLAWPVATVLLAIVFKSPLSDLFRMLQNFEYNKNKDGSQIKASFVSAGLEEAKESLEITDSSKTENWPTELTPKEAILNAFTNIEKVAQDKIVELSVNLPQEDFKGTPLSYLIYKGAFFPEIEAALQDMRILRNQVAHSHIDEIAELDAQDYLNVANRIERIIVALDRLPAMNLNAITMIVRNLSVILDSNKYSEITIDEVHQYIQDGTVLDFIAEFEEARELRGILKSNLWQDFAKFYIQSLQSIYYGYAGDERRKWGIEKSGICLLLAWTNEIIQMGSGWHPNTNLSHIE